MCRKDTEVATVIRCALRHAGVIYLDSELSAARSSIAYVARQLALDLFRECEDFYYGPFYAECGLDEYGQVKDGS